MSTIKMNPVNSPVTYHLDGWNEKANKILVSVEVNPILIIGNMEESFTRNVPGMERQYVICLCNSVINSIFV